MKKLYFSLLFALIAMNSAFAWMPAVNTTIYFKPNAAWQEDGATFELHFYSSGNVAKTMTLVVGTLDVYEALITSTELSGNTDFEIRRKVGSTQAANVYNLAGVNWDNGNCYELNGSLSKTANASAPSNGTMSTYTPPPPTAPTVTLTVTPTTVSVGGQVTLTNETVNFSGTPSIEYQVKFGTGGTYTTCTSPYTCTTMGDYYFKAIATYNSENATSTEKKVTANCFPHEGDVIYFKPIGWWFNGSVNFKANFSGGTTPVTIDFVLIEGDDSNIGNPDSRTGNVYALTVTAAAATNTTLNFQRGTYNTITGLENVDWCNYNCVNMTTVYEGAYNAGNSPMIVYTPPTTDPTVTLTLTPSTNPLLVNGTVALSATNSYFTNPGSVTYTYYVKLPSQPDYEALPITSPYTVTELGTYSFKVVGTEGLETDDDVKTILSTEPVKIRFKKPDSWASVYIYAWGGVPTSNTFGDWPGTTDANPSCDGWYEVTLPAGVTSIGNVIFNNNSGSQFDADNVTSAAACYTLTTSAATAVACPVPQPQSLLLAASATDVGIGATVILTPAPENICTPTYTYYVQVPGGSFVEIGSNTYNSFTVAGDYTFKVVETGTNLESDEIIVTVHANVTVKATLNEGVIWDGVMVYSWIGGTNSDEVADDANYHDACNNQTLWFSQEVPYGSNVIFHNAY
ncbi:MAG: starch-binding protein, partial [Prevotellaceae bacterium]|nr:starch-binding protein [Prevotellaceae bacterium]